MIIIGCNGFGREIIQDVYKNNTVAFYDDVTKNLPENIFGYKIYTNFNEVKNFLDKNGYFYVLGLGNPQNRYSVYKKMEKLNMTLKSTKSKYASIGDFDNHISEGVNIMAGSVITSSTKIGKASLINNNATICHDVVIGEFVEICPNATITGNCKIGDFSFIGANATILPNLIIGKNVTIGAGCVVTKNIPDNSVVVGVPGKIVKIKE
jgi:sugar O-acyltransferase (sialic acid O-acetyltransferase NeuD family)